MTGDTRPAGERIAEFPAVADLLAREYDAVAVVGAYEVFQRRPRPH